VRRATAAQARQASHHRREAGRGRQLGDLSIEALASCHGAQHRAVVVIEGRPGARSPRRRAQPGLVGLVQAPDSYTSPWRSRSLERRWRAAHQVARASRGAHQVARPHRRIGHPHRVSSPAAEGAQAGRHLMHRSSAAGRRRARIRLGAATRQPMPAARARAPARSRWARLVGDPHRAASSATQPTSSSARCGAARSAARPFARRSARRPRLCVNVQPTKVPLPIPRPHDCGSTAGLLRRQHDHA